MVDEKKTTTKKKVVKKAVTPKSSKPSGAAQKLIQLHKLTMEWRKERRVRERSELFRKVRKLRNELREK